MVSAFLGACAADGEAPQLELLEDEEVVTEARSGDEMDEVAGLDVCGLAAALPEGDICRHACDPAAMAEQLLAEGSDTGNCYQLYCALTADDHVLVGVCLVP